MRCPPMIPDPVKADQLIRQEAFVLSAKSLFHLRIDAIAVLFFSMTDLPPYADIMMYDSRLNNFKVHMDYIKDKKNNDTNEPPKLSSNIPIEDYIEGLGMYLGGKIGDINFPMSWGTRENVLAPESAPPMVHKQPYSIKHELVSEDMVQRHSHGHTLYATDNAAVYDLLDTDLIGTKYHTTITPFKRRRGVRGVYPALKAQFCGPDFWDKMFRDNVAIIMTHTWNKN